jgi:hypothetical protein
MCRKLLNYNVMKSLVKWEFSLQQDTQRCSDEYHEETWTGILDDTIHKRLLSLVHGQYDGSEAA